MVNINGEDWRVLIVSSNHPKLMRSDGSFTIGVCDDNDKTIYVAEGLSNHYTRKVICHELTHACMFSYDVFLTIEQEEIVADLIATYGREIVCQTNVVFNRLKEKMGTW